jgi:hypothetical protein
MPIDVKVVPFESRSATVLQPGEPVRRIPNYPEPMYEDSDVDLWDLNLDNAEDSE